MTISKFWEFVLAASKVSEFVLLLFFYCIEHKLAKIDVFVKLVIFVWELPFDVSLLLHRLHFRLIQGLCWSGSALKVEMLEC